MRPPPRLHLPDPIAEGADLALDRDRAHYLRHVLRLVPGDPVRVFNETCGEWQARLTSRGLRPDHQTRPPPDPARPRGPALIVAALKRDALDLVVRMATELGAARLHPAQTERSLAARLNGDRLAAIAREAAEQCERLDLPGIAPLRPLAALLAAWPADQPIAAAIERDTAAPRLPRRAPAAPAAALLVGPEGGFTPRELDVLARHPFVHPVSLGPLVLRAETACAVGLGLLQAERGDVEPG